MKRKRKGKTKLSNALDELIPTNLPTKKKRKRKTENNKKRKRRKKTIAIYGNLGGHVFDPPKDCPYAFTMPDGGRWTDLGCCEGHMCKNECPVYKNLFARGKKKADREEELRRKGVKI